MLLFPLLLFLSLLSSQKKYVLFTTNTIPICYHKQVISDNKSSTSISLMSDLSFQQYNKRSFTKYVQSSRFFHHLQDEKSLLFSTFSNYFIKPTFCASKSGMNIFLKMSYSIVIFLQSK